MMINVVDGIHIEYGINWHFVVIFRHVLRKFDVWSRCLCEIVETYFVAIIIVKTQNTKQKTIKCFTAVHRLCIRQLIRRPTMANDCVALMQIISQMVSNSHVLSIAQMVQCTVYTKCWTSHAKHSVHGILYNFHYM